MEEIKLFSIPIYKFKYSDHIEFKESVTPFLENEDTWKRVNSLATHIDFTNSNLHKMDAFSPIKNFIQTNIELVMEDLGFQPNIQITGMWGTRHRNAQYHHRHNHGNSFLAGIYYLNGNNNSGTTFFSPHNSHSQIIPPVNPTKILVNGSLFSGIDRDNNFSLLLGPHISSIELLIVQYLYNSRYFLCP
ncbi:hypothetical protein CCP3SC1AL1_620011 [Gammaproteobacteria bacterium]